MEKRPATAEEAKALANPLRLRILRLCLDDALTNQELAGLLGRDPGTILHHVRTLVATGFLAAEPARRGARGAFEQPYRATGKSWTLSVGGGPSGMLAMVDAFRDEIAEVGVDDVISLTRLGVRLSPDAIDELKERLYAIAAELKERDDPAGTPVGVLIGLHRRRAEPARGRHGRRRTRSGR